VSQSHFLTSLSGVTYARITTLEGTTLKSNKKGIGCLVLIGLAVIIGIIGAVGSHSSSNTPAAPASASSSIPVNTPTAVPAGTMPAPAAPVSSAPAAPVSSAPAAPVSSAPAGPSMTTAQQQAVDAATGYLSMGQGFSEQGLLNQLTSSAGNGFPKSDAEFAISYLHPNWDQQAVDAAKGYLSMGQGFSEQGLLNQLTSSAGSGFTQAQAEFAISYLHPDWDAQAVDAAKGYLQLGGFSRASLLQQLTSSAGSGFTQAQAEYAVNQTMK
jgi:ABC-type transport system involved in multi-copper enzyme maturation permease subunit